MTDSFAVMSDNADEYASVNIQDVVMDTQLDITIEQCADVNDAVKFVVESVEDMAIDIIAVEDVTDVVEHVM